MALFEIDESSGLPVWVQVRNRFVYLIKTGHYRPGDQLPSVRTPGRRRRRQLQHREQGLRRLGTVDGYVESVRGRGVFVRDIGEDAPRTCVVHAADAEIEGCIRRCLALGMTHRRGHPPHDGRGPPRRRTASPDPTHSMGRDSHAKPHCEDRARAPQPGGRPPPIERYNSNVGPTASRPRTGPLVFSAFVAVALFSCRGRRGGRRARCAGIRRLGGCSGALGRRLRSPPCPSTSPCSGRRSSSSASASSTACRGAGPVLHHPLRRPDRAASADQRVVVTGFGAEETLDQRPGAHQRRRRSCSGWCGTPRRPAWRSRTTTTPSRWRPRRPCATPSAERACLRGRRPPQPARPGAAARSSRSSTSCVGHRRPVRGDPRHRHPAGACRRPCPPRPRPSARRTPACAVWPRWSGTSPRCSWTPRSVYDESEVALRLRTMHLLYESREGLRRHGGRSERLLRGLRRRRPRPRSGQSEERKIERSKPAVSRGREGRPRSAPAGCCDRTFCVARALLWLGGKVAALEAWEAFSRSTARAR